MFGSKSIAIAASALSLGFAGTASASGTPAVNLTTPGDAYQSSIWTLGFEFTVNSTTTIDALGVFDNGAALTQDAFVGIWNTSGVLLASGTVPATGATLIGDFAYGSISSFTLTPGTDYIIGAYYGDPNGIASSLNTGQGGTGSFNPDINVIDDKFVSSSSLTFPGSTDGFAGGAWLGANFIIGSVPEPSAWAFMIAGVSLTGLGLRRRRAVVAV